MLRPPSNSASSNTMQQTSTEPLSCVGGPWSHTGSVSLLPAAVVQKKIIYSTFLEKISEEPPAFYLADVLIYKHIWETSDQEHMQHIWDLLDLLHMDHTNACM